MTNTKERVPDFVSRRPGSQTLNCLLQTAAQRWPDRVALAFEPSGQEIAFGELKDRVQRTANGLHSLGVEPGTRVAVMLDNVPEFPIAWLAIAHLGAAIVPVNTFAGKHDLRSQLDHSDPSVLVIDGQYADQVGATFSTSRPFIVVGDGATSVSKAIRWDSLHSRTMADECVPVAAFPESTVNIQYTSGSTGRPKGCMLSHAYWVEIARAMVTHGPMLNERDRLLTAQPFYYMDPQWNLAAALATGARLVVADRFHPRQFWSTVQKHDITFFYCLGVMPAMLLNTEPSPEDRRSRVRYIACSAIPSERHAALEERFGAPWHELYGSTETGVDMIVEVDEHDTAVGTGTLGHPMPNREVRIQNPDSDRPATRGSRGHLLIRGSYMSQGYFRDSAATSRAFDGGWYATGDLARQDDNGLVYFEGRTKDIIRRSGENIPAIQIEQVLEQHPLVSVAACLPVADSVRGEEVKAYIATPTQPTDEQLRSLIEHTEENLAYFKVPRFWEFRRELPLTASEKVAKSKLRNERELQEPRRCFDRSSQTWVESMRPIQ